MDYQQHLIRRIKNDLEFLVSKQALTQQDYDGMAHTLDVASLGTEVKAIELVRKIPPPSLPRRPSPTEICVARFDYTMSAPDDLNFVVGDEIILLERLNNDWWRGKREGREGIFPANHVELIQNQKFSQPAIVPPTFNSNDSSQFQPTYNNFNSPGPAQSSVNYYGQSNQVYQNDKIQPFAPPDNYPYHPSPPVVYQQPIQPAPAPPPAPAKRFGFGGGTGGAFKQALVGGVGFGVGSAVAGEAIHAIF